MKPKFFNILLTTASLCLTVGGNTQANQTLSNLTSPTSVNQSLLPASTNTKDLGSSSLGWRNIYIANSLYLQGLLTMYSRNTGGFFAGIHAGNATFTGNSNSGFGQNALFSLTSGYANTASGYNSLYSNTTGYSNTAYGDQSMYSNNSGHYNSAVGEGSLQANTSGNYNTAVGVTALDFNSTGSYNTSIGYYSGVQYSNLTNTSAVGYYTRVDASNQVRIGNTVVTSIGGDVGWSVVSDGRFKRNIKDNVAGLAFINNLHPITYTIDVKALNEHYRTNLELLDSKAKADWANSVGVDSKIVYSGFIAQEVEKTAKKLNYNFSGIDKPQTENSLYGLRYDNFVVPLVKAVQELSYQNELLQKQIDELKSLILNSQKGTISNDDVSASHFNVIMAQNAPNPFYQTTTISYNISQKFKNAVIVFSDQNGTRLKEIKIDSNKGAINLDASTLPSGLYNYSLIVDGQITCTKQMI